MELTGANYNASGHLGARPENSLATKESTLSAAEARHPENLRLSATWDMAIAFPFANQLPGYLNENQSYCPNS